jgi:hypothetical protein
MVGYLRLAAGGGPEAQSPQNGWDVNSTHHRECHWRAARE